MLMKRFLTMILVPVCALLLAMPAQAQLLKLGVKGGLNLASMDTKLSAIKKNSTGFFIGPMAELTVPIVGIGVDAAIMYARKGKDNFTMEGIEVPVNLKFSFGAGSMLGVYLAAGPDFFYNFKDVSPAVGTGYQTEKKSAQVGINLGGGLKLLRHLQVGVNYSLPLQDSFVLTGTGNDVEKVKFNTWQLSLAYTF